MNSYKKLVLLFAAMLVSTTVAAQQAINKESEELKIAAMDALISAPPERALPIVHKVLDGNHSDELKGRALFILSQIDASEAQSTLLRFANESDGELQEEAIRMIGISGNADTLTSLRSIYDGGNRNAKEAVLEALMIAGDKQAVYDIAKGANGDEYEDAVDMLSVMGARAELRELHTTRGASEALIDAYAISGDLESLIKLAKDSSNEEMQSEAIEAMGIVGGDEVDATLVQIYREATTESVREAALDGMLISGNDEGVLELFRSATSATEKKELLEHLVVMGSDEVWKIVDDTLQGED